MSDQRSVPEFSRFVQVTAAGVSCKALSMRANDAECKALAKRLELQSMSDLCLELSFRRTAVGRPQLNVTFSANVIQSCIVSLDAVSERVSDQFSVVCEVESERRSGQMAQVNAGGEVLVDPFGEDLVEFIKDGEIDVGELATQYLSLALNLYPRAPGNERKVDLTCLGDNKNSNGEKKEQENPFSILAFRRDGKESDNCT